MIILSLSDASCDTSTSLISLKIRRSQRFRIATPLQCGADHQPIHLCSIMAISHKTEFLNDIAKHGVIACCIVLLFYYVMRYLFDPKRKNLPPGPSGIPILGYLPFMPSNNERILELLHHKHGKIFSIRLGSQDVVFVSDFEIIKKITMRTAFNCRPDYSFVSFIMPSSLSYCEYPVSSLQKTLTFHPIRERRGMERAA